MNIKLPEAVEYILNTLEDKGYRADIVGGSVRDSILEREIGDYDITTSALPEETEEVFSSHRIIETGIQHGTVSLLLDGTAYEITTYRTDGEYLDNRHPSSVSFVRDIREDLCRRDFTVNAMAYSPAHGLTDLFGGREDLERGIIRAVGDPCRRFEEDALRILRALRFASVLGFSVDKSTEEAARGRVRLLRKVSRERIYVELKKLFAGKSAYDVLSRYGDMILSVLPGLEALRLPPRELFDKAEGEVRLLSVYALSAEGKCEDVYYDAMSELKTDRLTRFRGASALSTLDCITELVPRTAAVLLKSYGEDAAELAVKLGIVLKGMTEKSLEVLKTVINGALPYKISHLKVGGEDLKPLGYRDVALGKALNSLLLAVINGECENDRNSLLSYLEKAK